MGAPDLLFRLAAAGIELKPLPDGRLWAGPRERLTDELRALIVANRAELLAVLDPAAEARRQKVLAMLTDNQNAKYAVVTDIESDPANVILTLAIRGKVTCEMLIPRAKYDPFLLLDLIEKHAGTVH